jgi:Flp pilus assembly protein TadG
MWLSRFRKNKRGISTVITVVLSLVIVVVIVANVVLWSYNMNQHDLERQQENLSLTVVQRSTWFTVQSEYRINAGSLTGGSYLDTKADDGGYETFREGFPRRLDINGTFIVDLATYPLAYVQGIEILLKFQASDTGEAWYLKAYDWTTSTYSSNSFNTTNFTPTTTTGWDYYRVGITTGWTNYIRSSDGKMFIQFHDNVADGTQTTIRIDFLGIRVKTTQFSFRNSGPTTSHIVALWVTNSTLHSRYNVNYYVNAGANAAFFNTTIPLPKGQFTTKAVTERGNIIVYSS